ncbi:MAG: Tfp pilus assembly protein FimT/FimU [Mariniblastus sp.]
MLKVMTEQLGKRQSAQPDLTQIGQLNGSPKLHLNVSACFTAVWFSKSQTSPKRCRPSVLPDRNGLTLLELMVVLVILAIVATVAIQSLQPQIDNQRFQASTRLLGEIKTATLGPIQKYQVDGTPLISGFLCDVGRLPMANAPGFDVAQPTVLGELWDTESQLADQFPFQFRPGPAQPIDYSSVRLPCGWKGPYLQLPLGAKTLSDAWGQPPEILEGAMGQTQVVSITVPITGNQTEPNVLTAELTTGKVEVTGKVLVDNAENAQVRVALLTPNPESSLTTLAVLDDEDEQLDSFLFRDVPIGLRAIVAEVDGKRQTKYVQVPHGGVTVCFDFQARQTETP